MDWDDRDLYRVYLSRYSVSLTSCFGVAIANRSLCRAKVIDFPKVRGSSEGTHGALVVSPPLSSLHCAHLSHAALDHPIL